MYKLHLLQHPDWYRTGTSYCYFYIFEIIHHYSVISKINPSFFTIKEGSTAFPKPLSPQGTGDVTAPPRRSEPLRSKVGGASKPSPDCAGWDRLGITILCA